MPIEITDDILDAIAEQLAKRNGRNGASASAAAAGGDATTDSEDRFHVEHPEGGGPFKGRNNAAYAYCGWLWRKRIRYSAALFMADAWNKTFCKPPLEEEVISDIVSRAYANANTGDWEQDAEDREFGENARKPALEMPEILTVEDLLVIADDPNEQFKWLADDLIQEDGITIFAGPSGHGKTWLALDLARHMARGEDEDTGQWLDQWELPRKRVLYMDEENGKKTMAKRVKALGFTPGVGNFLSWSYSGFDLMDTKGRARLIGIAKHLGAEVLIFDSLIAIQNGDENNASWMRKVGDCLSEFVQEGFTVIALHHDKKSPNGSEAIATDQNQTRGSGDITSFSQTVLGVVRKNGVFTVGRRKVRNADYDEEEVFVFQIQKDLENGGVYLDVEGAKEEVATRKRMKKDAAMALHRKRVAEATRILKEQGQPVTHRAIAKTAQMSLTLVGEVLSAPDPDTGE